MNLVDFAKVELDKIIKDSKDDSEIEMQKEINKDILEIINVFAKQGHSGFTADYCIRVLSRLLRYKPLTPLTGEDDEWESNPFDTELLQNKRYPAVFKDVKNGNAFNTEAKIFSDDDGETWYTSVDSKADISFPYTVPDKPKSILMNKEK